MARIRTIKPDYWTSDRVGECSPTARLLFIATWNFADDEGGLDRSAKQLKAQAFPYDQIDCEPLIQELLKVGLLVEYEANGKKYLHIKGFGVHQKIEKKARARFPIYKESMRTHRGVGEESGSSAVSSLEGNGMEWKGTKEGAASPPGLASRNGKSLEPELHASLPKETWIEWIAHRRSRKWPVDSVTLRKQLALLSRYTTEEQRASIDNSIQAGWQGLFPPKGRLAKPHVPAMSTEEAEAEAAARGH